jgi:glycosyltransferase involved in cell wall biosynthesis
MASGLPAVVTGVGDIPLMLCAGQQAFILNPGDESGYAAALKRLAEDGELRAALGVANRRRVEMEYALEGMLAAYRGLYWEAAGRRG